MGMVSVTSDGVIYVGANSNGLVKSVDGGFSWTVIEQFKSLGDWNMKSYHNASISTSEHVSLLDTYIETSRQ
jgi:hypothetical protein